MTKNTFPIKAAMSIGFIVLLLGALPRIPSLERFGGLDLAGLERLLIFPAGFGPTSIGIPNEGSAEAANTGAHTTIAPKPSKAGIATLGSPENNAPRNAGPGVGGPVYLFDSHHVLNGFYDALRRTEIKEPGAETLILHYGDSPVTADSITADARSILQARFGDGGHGFLLIAKPWAWYGHRGTEVRGKGWKIEPATQSRARDGLHGLGGVSFTGSAGAWSTVSLKAEQSSLEVEYLKQPNGGAFSISAGGQKIGDVATEAPEKSPGFAQFDLPPGTHDIKLDVTSGSVRLFGYSFRRNEPGVIYSSLGLNGGQVQMIDRYFQVRQWAEQLQHQHPDLLILNYGTNESVFPAYVEKDYGKELREVIGKIQAALPGTPILVMSPMDRGQRDGNGAITTPAILPKIVDIQKQAALETGCAFFDTYDAMGGAGTMGRWYESQPRLVSADFMHPLPGGAAKVGSLLAEALTAGLNGRLQARQRAASEANAKKP